MRPEAPRFATTTLAVLCALLITFGTARAGDERTGPADAFLRGLVAGTLRSAADAELRGAAALVGVEAREGHVRVRLPAALAAKRGAVERLLRVHPELRSLRVEVADDVVEEDAGESAGRSRRWLPRGALLAPPLADLIEPRIAGSILSADLGGGRRTYAVASIGHRFGIFAWSVPRGRFQLDFGVGVVSLFDMDGRSQDLQNADYRVGASLSFARKRLSARLRFFHASSHLGDEFLLNPQPLDIGPRREISYEALELLAARPVGSRLRLYGGGTLIVSSATDLEPSRLQLGAEAHTGDWLGGIDTFAAVDVQSWQETDWDLDARARLGVRLPRAEAEARRLRVYLEVVRGHPQHGQFYVLDTSTSYGVGASFGF
jgi:hypothetical protein